MPKGSEKLTAARKEEIIDACAKLYETMPFKNITLGEIGAQTTFTRTSIYNYFRTKEEIFLALLEREYKAWIADMDEITQRFLSLSVEELSKEFARVLEKRKYMLKLMSMNLYDMEAGSRLENLVAFKRVYGESMQSVVRCLEKFFPSITKQEEQEFIYAFFPFLFGVYPYTAATEKQVQAMEIAQIPYVLYSISEITSLFVEKLLKSFSCNQGKNDCNN